MKNGDLVKLMIRYLHEVHIPQGSPGLKRQRWQQSTPLFTWKNANRVKANEISQALKMCLNYLNIDEKKYYTHSFRLGAATKSAMKAASDTELRLLRRWRSDSFLGYIRPQSFRFKY